MPFARKVWLVCAIISGSRIGGRPIPPRFFCGIAWPWCLAIGPDCALWQFLTKDRRLGFKVNAEAHTRQRSRLAVPDPRSPLRMSKQSLDPPIPRPRPAAKEAPGIEEVWMKLAPS
jgi:hypothetical protein